MRLNRPSDHIAFALFIKHNFKFMASPSAIADARQQHIERLERQLVALQYGPRSDVPLKCKAILHELKRRKFREEQLRLVDELLQAPSGLPGSNIQGVILFAVSDTPESNLIAESVNFLALQHCCHYGKHCLKRHGRSALHTNSGLSHCSACGKQF